MFEILKAYILAAAPPRRCSHLAAFAAAAPTAVAVEYSAPVYV